MKKLLALILSLTCVFAIAFTACTDVNVNIDGSGNSGNNNNGQTSGNENNEQTGGNGNNENNEQTGGNGNNENNEQTHTCTYSNTWSYDSQTHWHASTCSQHPENKKDEAPHTYENGECSDCGREEFYEVGDKLPDFTVEAFETDSYKEATFSSASARDKVLVINFWYVTCGICVDEMPDIEQTQNDYSDDVVIIALHASGSAHASDLAAAQPFINNKGWNSYNVIFGKDLENDRLYKATGTNNNAYPVTIVLNAEGVITAKINGNIKEFNMSTYEYTNKLNLAIEAALGR